jgi:hypothetical protein
MELIIAHLDADSSPSDDQTNEETDYQHDEVGRDENDMETRPNLRGTKSGTSVPLRRSAP